MTGKEKRIWARWLTAALATSIGAVAGGVALFHSAFAVHGSPFPFELDGNIANAAGVFGPPASGDGLDDWQNVFDLTGGNTSPQPGNGEAFIRDLPTGSPAKETQYNAGKDSLDLNGWTRKLVSAVNPDKDNITDAFAKVYMVDVDGAGNAPLHRVIYFGADRLANNGDAALGFWFFQRQVQLTGAAGTGGFSPNHTARNIATGQRGDILVQADFVSGGSSSEIQIFEWVGTGGNFGGGTLQEIGFGHANGNTVCLTGDVACATTNEVNNIDSFWPYVPKAGTANKLPSESFFEGGIDMTALVGDICFNTFLANTRTSHSETADLKDLAMGDFNTCGSIDLVDKHCVQVAGVSPLYDDTTGRYQTRHLITIRNDGQGSNVFDVQVRDDSVSANNTCNITAISGGIGNPSIPAGGIAIANNTTFYQVADQLAAGIANQMTVTILCQSTNSDFANAASIRAGQTDGGTSLTDNYAEDTTEGETCPLTLTPSLTVTKTCATVTLDASHGFDPKVCNNITIQNTSSPAQTIDVDSFTDDHEDGSQSDLLSFITLVNGKHPIAPGATVTINNHCYYPASPDASQTDPDLVQYSDDASAHAVGRASGEAMDTSDTATCPLCPTGLDGAP